MRLDTTEKRQQYRAAMIPQGAQRDPRSTDYAEAFTYQDQRTGRLCALGFIGTSAHPTWHYAFRNEAQREQYIAEFFANQSARQDAKTARKAERENFTHTLKVGDLVHTSWGYDQTNVEFFEVVRVVSNKSVAVRQIAADQVETGFMCGNITPCPGKFIGPEAVRRVRQGNVIINVIHGHYDGYPCGREAQRNSWYA